MGLLGAAAGLALIGWMLVEAFEAMVLPRRVTRPYRLNRFFYRHGWTLWRAAALRLPAGKRRDNFLAIFGPLSILGLMTTWVAGLIFGFALMHWSLETPLHLPSPDETAGMGSYLYLSGVTFFTLGYGDITAAGTAGRLLTVWEAGLGFGFLAVVIGYLPVLYGAFSRREAAISMLDARAGSPPSAGQLLLRLSSTDSVAAVDPFLAEWERWSAEVLESHLSFPLLSYYRCQHDNQSWLGALTAVLDTCALLLTVVRGADRYQAQLTFAMARHVAVDLALAFATPPQAPDADRLPLARLAELVQVLHPAGLAIREDSAAVAKLAELRAAYEPFVTALGRHFLFGIPSVWPETTTPDNWQTSAWMRRTAGFGSLAVDPADDHAD